MTAIIISDINLEITAMKFGGFTGNVDTRSWNIIKAGKIMFNFLILIKIQSCTVRTSWSLIRILWKKKRGLGMTDRTLISFPWVVLS